MKEKIHYGIEAALAVAVIILFVLVFTGNKKTSNTNVAVSSSENVSEIMPIAYVDIDSLISTYTYSIDMNELLTRKFEDSQARLNKEAQKFQQEQAEFQRKYETNSFLSQDRAQSAYNLLMKKQESLQQLDAQLSQELAEERMSLQNDLRKTIIEQVAAYNQSKGYQIIYGKAGENILFANEAYNITAEVIEYLNLQYAEAPVLKLNE